MRQKWKGYPRPGLGRKLRPRQLPYDNFRGHATKNPHHSDVKAILSIIEGCGQPLPSSGPGSSVFVLQRTFFSPKTSSVPHPSHSVRPWFTTSTSTFPSSVIQQNTTVRTLTLTSQLNGAWILSNESVRKCDEPASSRPAEVSSQSSAMAFPSCCGFVANCASTAATRSNSRLDSSQRLGGLLSVKRRVSKVAVEAAEWLLLSLGLSKQLTVLPDRKPVDPPPIVQLKIKRDVDPEQSYLQSTTFLISSFIQRTN